MAVAGDVSAPGLALSGDDAALLAARVSVVFHCAANVRFDLSIKEAVSLNTVGTRNVLLYAKTIENLDVSKNKNATSSHYLKLERVTAAVGLAQAFIHVSTAYCHCDEEVLEERTYMTDVNPERVIDMIQWVDPNVLKEITPK